LHPPRFKASGLGNGAAIRGLKSRLWFRPTFLVLRQLIGQSEPIELAAHVCVVLGRELVWSIKATRRDVDLVLEVLVLESQLRAALRTETPRAFYGGPEPRGLTTDDSELRASHAEPRDQGSASGSTTDRTMAVRFVKGSARCLVTDPSAKTSALEHSITY
jgi:hypothetical protein